MLRLRNLLIAIPVSALFAVSGLAAGTQEADAFVTSQDYCLGIFNQYNRWGNEAIDELVRSNGEETSYFNYAWDMHLAYGRMWTTNNC